MTRFVVISTTTAKAGDARRIARALVERRLAACVQVLGPMKSTYRWQGRVETATEWLCLAKTTLARSRKLAAAVAELHPYEIPEVTVTPITGGSPPYLGWLAESVAAPRRKR